MYQETTEEKKVKEVAGTKYDLFVKEMKARKGGRWRAPEEGYYAPEREIGEFYSPGR